MSRISKRIVLLGPPGSGKGTQADILSTKLRLPHIATGDIFRWHITHHTVLGRRLQPRLRQGRLAPDRVVNRIVGKRLRQRDCGRGYILDGYPRTLNQAKFLERVTPPNLVIALELRDREAVTRLGDRRIAPDGTIYHLRFNPPPKRLRAQLKIRDDDRPTAVRRRLHFYRRLTTPLLRFYERKGALKIIDGRLPISNVTRLVLRSVRLRFAGAGTK